MRWLCAGIVVLLSIVRVPVAAQEAVTLLNLAVVEGEGATNNIRQRTAREPIVQVEDQNHRPIGAAAVTFSLPARGAGGVFPNGSRTVTVLTDNNGRAVARGMRPNTVKGQFEIRVNASFSGMTASTVITQTNAIVAGAAAGAVGLGITAKVLIIAAVAGAAVAGGVVAVTRDGGSGSSSAANGPNSVPTTISPGTGTVGPPR